ncbi:MAG: FAD binding domain-containing protein [Vallitaleaceae bacterium]|nr:FAD binding domain-containing protein [Vallitaleaceae bacterium]
MVESFRPKTYEEVLEIISQKEVVIIAGGTDLMVKNRNWSSLPPLFKKDVLFLNAIEELKYIRKEADGLHIGSMTTLTTLLGHPDTPVLLKKAISLMASPAIRHSGTLGGNIGNASPAGDTLPVLYVLGAQVVLESKVSIRIVPIETFIQGPGKKDLANNEVIKEIIIENAHFDHEVFEKVGGRKSDAISKNSFCGVANCSGTKLVHLRIAFGAVGPTVIRNREIEEKAVKGGDIAMVLHAYAKILKPIDDQRSSAIYRKQCSLNLLEGFLKELK